MKRREFLKASALGAATVAAGRLARGAGSAIDESITARHPGVTWGKAPCRFCGTGCGVLVNTSFNVRGEPIVCTPDDAYRCFINTEMDFLVMGSFVLERAAQPHKTIPRKVELVPD